jgi:hypothetical protein
VVQKELLLLAHSCGERYSRQAGETFATGGRDQKSPIWSGLFSPHAKRCTFPKLPKLKRVKGKEKKEKHERNRKIEESTVKS